MHILMLPKIHRHIFALYLNTFNSNLNTAQLRNFADTNSKLFEHKIFSKRTLELCA